MDELERSRAEMQIAVKSSDTCSRELNSKTEEGNRREQDMVQLRREIEKVSGENNQIRADTDDSKKLLAKEKEEKLSIIAQNGQLQKQANDQNIKLQSLLKEVKNLEAFNVKLARESEEANRKKIALEQAMKEKEEERKKEDEEGKEDKAEEAENGIADSKISKVSNDSVIKEKAEETKPQDQVTDAPNKSDAEQGQAEAVVGEDKEKESENLKVLEENAGINEKAEGDDENVEETFGIQSSSSFVSSISGSNDSSVI